MANETTSSTLSELFTNITQEAIFTFQETSVMRPLVTTYPLSMEFTMMGLNNE